MKCELFFSLSLFVSFSFVHSLGLFSAEFSFSGVEQFQSVGFHLFRVEYRRFIAFRLQQRNQQTLEVARSFTVDVVLQIAIWINWTKEEPEREREKDEYCRSSHTHTHTLTSFVGSLERFHLFVGACADDFDECVLVSAGAFHRSSQLRCVIVVRTDTQRLTHFLEVERQFTAQLFRQIFAEQTLEFGDDFTALSKCSFRQHFNDGSFISAQTFHGLVQRLTVVFDIERIARL